MTEKALLEHIREENKASPFQTYLKEIVYGGNDGIVTTFAVVAGFAGAEQSSLALPVLAVLVFGFANLFADSISMGLGNFLSIRSEKDVYKKEKARELSEIRKNPHLEKEETMLILKHNGFTDEQAKNLTEIYATNEQYWLSFMMNHELQLPNPTSENPMLTGLATIVSFILFGLIPLLPYLLFGNTSHSFVYSSIFAGIALFLLGLVRWRVTKESLFRSVSEIVLIGSLAACVAYLVGAFFKM